MDAGTVNSGKLWQDGDGPSFSDLLDVINPLQHIPIVSTIYRAITGDKIAMGPRLIGGAIFGGPLGFISAGIMSAVEEATGKDSGEQLADLFRGDEPPADGKATAVAAAAEPAAGTPAAPAAVIPAAAIAPAATRPAAIPVSAVAPATLKATQAARDAGAAPQPYAKIDRNNAMAALDRAKGAQAAMLAASLQVAAAPAKRNADDAPQADKPLPQHANLPPAGVALPEWAAQAMERALDSYQRSGTLHRDSAKPMVTITE
jgi:hypothetical protein